MHQMTGRPYVALGYNCYDYAVGFLNFIQFQGCSTHTISSIEKNLLNVPAQRAIKYLEYWRRISRSRAIPYPFKVPSNKEESNDGDDDKRAEEKIRGNKGQGSKGGVTEKAATADENGNVEDNISLLPHTSTSLKRQFSGESKKNPTKGVVRIVLYADGFTVNGGNFRSTENMEKEDDNKSFVTALLNGKVPKELVAMAEGGKLEVDLEDLRPKLGGKSNSNTLSGVLVRTHKGSKEYLHFESGGSVTYIELKAVFLSTAMASCSEGKGIVADPSNTLSGVLVRTHKGSKEYLHFESGGSVTYIDKGSCGKIYSRFTASSYSIEDRPYKRFDGKIVQRKYFLMKGNGEFQGKEQVWEWDRFKMFHKKRAGE
eukprot:CAMPEP_0185280628 /NCGR_PEP_ID=MMETSP1359-20130426/66246_1 /TAXON_ID=552665 /ORGANISM="Bigelowiella longifila, Strain CCMP242" /LENGTH=370 /DNA_ID=CAMNT_0027875925 /DNA_START=270 /DNA_END=1383 /DNA_ORIENTATION=+